jgi:two-component system, response regulator
VTDQNRTPCILLVDDSVMDVELTLNAWRELQRPCQIEVAKSGAEAFARVQDWATGTCGASCHLPDLILLDLKLPGTDGFEILRQLKGTPALRRTPVVILTSSREDEDRAMAYDLGANSYLVKPVSFAGFVSLVTSIDDYWLALNLRPPQDSPHAGRPA